MKILDNKGIEWSTLEEAKAAEERYEKEEAYKKAKEEKELKDSIAKVESEKAAISKRKKELSDNIENAQKKYDESYQNYLAYEKEAKDIIAKARKEANEIISAANKKANNLLQVAADELKNASNEKSKAVREFNKEFGVYRTTLTAEQAMAEYNRIMKDIDKVFDNSWIRNFWNNTWF